MRNETEYSVTELREYYAEATGRARWAREHIQLLKNGKTVAWIVAHNEYNPRLPGETVILYSARQARAVIADIISYICAGKVVLIKMHGKDYVAIISPALHDMISTQVRPDGAAPVKGRLVPPECLW